MNKDASKEAHERGLQQLDEREGKQRMPDEPSVQTNKETHAPGEAHRGGPLPNQKK